MVVQNDFIVNSIKILLNEFKLILMGSCEEKFEFDPIYFLKLLSITQSLEYYIPVCNKENVPLNFNSNRISSKREYIKNRR